MDELVESEILHRNLSKIYISLELLLRKAKWREILRSDLFQQRMVGFIVDEAYCVEKRYVNLNVAHTCRTETIKVLYINL
jgi:hypothetical protein